jgi:hypothetical protein
LNRPLGFYSFFSPVRFTSVNWRRLLSFPFLVPHLLQPTSPHHDTAPCHASFSWSQDELTVSSSSSSNTSSHRISPQAETKALNSHHHHRPPYPDRPTLTLYCYEKIVSTLPTLPTTQSCLHFASSLARAPHHQSSIHHHCSLSPSSHAHTTTSTMMN